MALVNQVSMSNDILPNDVCMSNVILLKQEITSCYLVAWRVCSDKTWLACFGWQTDGRSTHKPNSEIQVWYKSHRLAKHSDWVASLSQFKRNCFLIFTYRVKIQPHFREGNCFDSHFCLINGINTLHLIFPIILRSSWYRSLHSWASSTAALSSNHTDSTATWYAQPRNKLWLKQGAISQDKCRRK